MEAKKLRTIGQYARYSIKALFRDQYNRIRFGPEAPRFSERIWVNPKECVGCLAGFGDRDSARVIVSDWPPRGGRLKTFDENFKIRCCFLHWVQGVPWKETGIFDFLEEEIRRHPRRCFDDCRNRRDIEERYARLDALFEEIKNSGRLKRQREIERWSFREKGGIFFHLGDCGRLFFGGGGNHRFAMALILGLARVPAKIGCVHLRAIPRLRELRKVPQRPTSRVSHE
jgi:hypothetical protein